MSNGIFISEGMSLTLSGLQISITDDGEVDIKSPTLSLAYDACLAWARIALQHQSAATAAQQNRNQIWSDLSREKERGGCLDREFEFSIQAIVAMASSIDAFYDQIAIHSKISDETRQAWRKNKTARHVQISETFRTAFNLKGKGLQSFTNYLQALYTLRDLALHPTSRTSPAMLHPDLDVGTEWRFVTFRGDVADSLVCGGLGAYWDIAHSMKFKNKGLEEFIQSFKQRLDKVLPEGKPAPLQASVTFPRGPANGQES